MDYLKEKRKTESKESLKIRRKNIKERLEKQKSVAKGVSIDDITDINTLIKLYSACISRGKKQRIKKKLVKLGYNPQYLPTNFNDKIPKQGAKDDIKKSNYTVTKLEFGNENITKSKVKYAKKEEKRFRNRENRKNKKADKANKDYDDDMNDVIIKQIKIIITK